ncbi:MAG: hypothetical protein JRE71_13530 [Deltaproteobacteria bacterium]|nr:hypothetical protein [Deltaproteobacteria bacterium]
MEGFVQGVGQIRFRNPEPMIMHAKAGHAYVTMASASSTNSSRNRDEKELKTYFWIEDVGTGEVVSGTRPDSETNAHLNQRAPRSSSMVPGTAADPQLQADITKRLFEEATKYHQGCEHRVLNAEAYKAADRSVIVTEMGEEGAVLAKRLQAKDQMLVQKWFVESCESADGYEVLLLRGETGTDILVVKLPAGVM